MQTFNRIHFWGKGFYYLLLVCLFSLIFTKTVSAATGINHTINFQGKLVNSDGTNVTNGSYSIVFSLYTVSSGGTAAWTETDSVTAADGVFRVSLGAGTTFSSASIDFTSDTYYLGIKVGSDAEMTPRVQFSAVPYAFNAEKVNGLTVTNNGGNTLNIAANKTFTVNNSVTLNGTDATSFTFPTTSGGTVLTTNQATQTVTSGQTSGTIFSITAGAPSLGGALTGLQITTNGTGSQDQTGLKIVVSGATGTNQNGLVINNGTSDTLTVTKTGVITDTNYAGSNAIMYAAPTTGLVTTAITTTGSQCLTSGSGSNGIPIWGSCGGGTNYWSLNGSTISPANGAVNVAIGQTTALANSGLDVEVNSLGNAALVVNNTGGFGDIFTASTSGASAFTIKNNGTVVIGKGDGSTPIATTIRGAAGAGSNIAGANLTLDASNGTGAGGSGDLIFRTAGSAANGTVTFDRAQSTNDGASGAVHSFTWTNGVTVSSGHSNNLLIVGITLSNANTIATVTYNGTSMTNLTGVTCPSNLCRTEFWYLTNPTADGAGHNVVVTLSGVVGNVANWEIGASSYYNVDQTTPLGTATTNTGTTASTQAFSNSISTANTNQIAVDMVAANQALTLPTQTSRWNNTSVDTAASSNATGTGGSISFSWTANSANWAWIGDTINPVSNNAIDTLADRLHITNTGSIGINNATPLATLDVRGNSGITPIASLSGSSAFAGLVINNSGTGDLFTASSAGLARFTVQQNGTVVVGNDSGSQNEVTLRGGQAAGTNVAGANMNIASSNGTGTAGSGDLLLKTASANSNVVQRESVSSALQTNTGTNTLTWSHSVGQNSNRLLMVGVTTFTTSITVSSVTYNGVALTAKDTQNCSSSCREEVWYLVNPPIGAHNIVVTTSANDPFSVGAISFSNVDQVTPLGASTKAGSSGGTDTSSTINVASTTTNQLVTDFYGNQATSTFTPAPGANQSAQVNVGSTTTEETAISTKIGNATTTAMKWTWTSGNTWADIGMGVNPASSGTNDALTDRIQVTSAGNILLQGSTFASIGMNASASGSTAVINAIGDQGSLVPNAGFESNVLGGFADGWVATSSNSATITNDQTLEAKGNSSAKITLKSQSTAIYSACIPLTGLITSGAAYNLNWYARGTTLSPTVRGYIDQYTSQNNCVSNISPTVSGSAGTVAVTNGSWAVGGNVAVAITNVIAGTTWARVHFFVGCASTACNTETVNLDGVRLVENLTSTGVDYAENYPADPNNMPEAGDVVSLQSGSSSAQVVPANKLMDTAVIGVVSTNPGQVLDDGSTADAKVPIALAGRIPTKVSTENGMIHVGDYLTSSDIPGVAVKAVSAGPVIGIAMEDYIDSDVTHIKPIVMFVKNTYYPGYISLDATAILSGDKTTANQVEGLDVITTQLAQLSSKVASLSANMDVLGASTSATEVTTTSGTFFNGDGSLEGLLINNDATVSGKLRVKGSALIEGILSVIDTFKANDLMINGIAEFFNTVVFHNDVSIEGRPTFNADTAGFALIKKGNDHVDISFDKQYDTMPIINATLMLTSLSITPTSIDGKTLEQQLLDEKYTYLITNRSQKGFTIMLNTSAGQDIEFSWSALSIKDAKRFQSSGSIIMPSSSPTITQGVQ